ncbi:MAG TPA: TetR/AcrR family transcriptional regulator [Thermodesulfobacteriota bacterium]|nr:TetR/AcrR family transcriptional regulator [Thermodesulfobacteriota bacterium]
MAETKKIESQIKDKKLVETRRREIVKAAVDLFIKKGFHKTTVREIAQKFGMSIGTMYEYIRTKEDILYLVCDYIHSNVREKVRPSLTISGNFVETLKRAIYAYVTVIDEMQDYVVFLYQETKSLNYEARKYIFRAEEEMTQIFEEILVRGVEEGAFSIDKKDLSLVAHNIMVMGHMWAFRRWVLQKDYSLERYIRTQTSLVLNGLKADIKSPKL